MKQHRLLVWMSSLMLVAASGCTLVPSTSHTPIPGAEHVDKNGKAFNKDTTSVWADEGATLTFSADIGNPNITVTFTKKNGPTPASVCTPLTGTSPLTCTVQPNTSGDYTVTITETQGSGPGNPPTATQSVTAYIRPCTGC